MSTTNNPISFFYQGTKDNHQLHINSTFEGDIYVNGALYKPAPIKDVDASFVKSPGIREDEGTCMSYVGVDEMSGYDKMDEESPTEQIHISDHVEIVNRIIEDGVILPDTKKIVQNAKNYLLAAIRGEDEYTPSEVQSESEQEIIRLYKGGEIKSLLGEQTNKEDNILNELFEPNNDISRPLDDNLLFPNIIEGHKEGSIEEFSIFLETMKTTHTAEIVGLSLDKSSIVLTCRFTPILNSVNLLNGNIGVSLLVEQVYKFVISSKEDKLFIDIISGKINRLSTEEYSFPEESK